jgi:hypothetical protein
MRRDFPDLSERMLKALLTDKYFTDQRTADAWQNRYSSPASWTREVERLRSEIYVETARPIDREQTEVRAALAAAVLRAAPGPAPEAAPPNYNSMDTRTFQADVKRRFGYQPKLA